MSTETTRWNDDRHDEFARNVDRRFDRVDKRFDKVDERFDRVEGRIDRVEARMDSGFDRLNDRFDDLMKVLIAGFITLIGVLLAAVLSFIAMRL